MAIPKIDPNVKFITWGQFRRLTGEQIQAGTTFVVEEQAVVVPYEVFLQMQDALMAAPPMPASLTQGGPASGSASARPGYDPTLGARVPGGPAPDSPLRGV